MQLDVAVRAGAVLGEGPTWDSSTSTLLWVDILASAVHRFDPVQGTDVVMDAPQHVGAAKPRANGGLVANLRDGVALLEPDGGKRWLVYWEREGVRGNDAAVDPAGRLWAGTMRYDEAPGGGWLARVEPDGAAKVIVDDVTISNGIGWSPDTTRMYYIDTPTRRIDVFDYDLDSGDAVNRQPLCAIEDTDGSPDGLCVDAEGCVWVALWGGYALRRYTPEGVLDREIQLPVRQPTACAFGGPDFTDLYVTTASVGVPDEELAGSLLVLPGIGVGVPSTVFLG